MECSMSPSSVWLKKLFEKRKSDNAFMGERITKIREILLPIFSNRKLELAITREVDGKTGQNLTERDIYFRTLYKASKVANIPLSDLVGKRPLETLLDSRRAIIVPASRDEIDKAQKVLAHLLLNEARRQKDVHGLTVTGLAIKSHLSVRRIKKIFLGEVTPLYSTLRLIVEDGMGIPLPLFLENFEAKLKSFERLPFTLKKRRFVFEQESQGPYQNIARAFYFGQKIFKISQYWPGKI